jgi:hypothetical protein
MHAHGMRASTWRLGGCACEGAICLKPITFRDEAQVRRDAEAEPVEESGLMAGSRLRIGGIPWAACSLAPPAFSCFAS